MRSCWGYDQVNHAPSKSQRRSEKDIRKANVTKNKKGQNNYD